MTDSKAMGKFGLRKKNLAGDVEDMVAVIKYAKICHVQRG